LTEEGPRYTTDPIEAQKDYTNLTDELALAELGGSPNERKGDTFSGVLPFALLVARLFTWLPAYRVLMVWVYDRTESQLVVTLMHVSLVATTGIIDPVIEGGSLLVLLLAKAAVFWVIVAAVFLTRRRDAQAASA
jgi:hypothetical protein